MLDQSSWLLSSTLITTIRMLDFVDHTGSITASTSLVRRVKCQDQDAWRRLARIYSPLVYRWARTLGLQPADAEDVVGEVFAGVVRSVERFQHDGCPHSFRRWLRTIASRCATKTLRKKSSRPIAAGGTTAAVHFGDLAAEDSHEQRLETQDEIEWVRQRAMKIIQDDFQPAYWDVFRRVSLDGETPAQVARAEGMSVWAVYKVQARILHRLRAELDEPF